MISTRLNSLSRITFTCQRTWIASSSIHNTIWMIPIQLVHCRSQGYKMLQYMAIWIIHPQTWHLNAKIIIIISTFLKHYVKRMGTSLFKSTAFCQRDCPGTKPGGPISHIMITNETMRITWLTLMTVSVFADQVDSIQKQDAWTVCSNWKQNLIRKTNHRAINRTKSNIQWQTSNYQPAKQSNIHNIRLCS